MVRLVLVVAPIVCLLGGVGMSCIQYFIIYYFPTNQLKYQLIPASYIEKIHVHGQRIRLFRSQHHYHCRHCPSSPLLCQPQHLRMFLSLVYFFFIFLFWPPFLQVASEAYSSPSIVLQARGHDGSKIIFDDFREAYRWLSQNTGDDEIVMSWWDYGYHHNSLFFTYIIYFKLYLTREDIKSLVWVIEPCWLTETHETTPTLLALEEYFPLLSLFSLLSSFISFSFS